MQRFLIVVLLLGLGGLWAVEFPSSLREAQKLPPPKCPSFRIIAPDGRQMSEDIWTFTALVEEVDSKTSLSYSWSVDRGKIKTGEGTATITIDRPDLNKGILVIVDIGGFPEGCPNQAKVSIIS